MEAILAANHLRIEFDADSWKLISNELATPTTLVEATPEGLVTHPVFRAARALSSATIAPAQVMRVMLGWAPENQAWRLGLLLTDRAGTVVDTTQMQWCELATWPQADTSANPNQMKNAGQFLARLLNRPFQLIETNAPTRVSAFDSVAETPSLADENRVVVPVSPSAAAVPAAEGLTAASAQAAPALPNIQQMALPLDLNQWRLIPAAGGVRWQRPRNWWMTNVGRLALIFALSILFLLLSIGSLTRGYASVDPDWLPNLGVVISIVLIFALAQAIWQVLSTKIVSIDTHHREVFEQGAIVPFVNWRVDFDAIQFILVTQTAPQSQGRRNVNDAMQISQDVWIHAYDGQNFYTIVEIETVEGKCWDWETVRTQHRTRVRRGLQLAHFDTPAHHAAQQIADIIGVRVYLDLI